MLGIISLKTSSEMCQFEYHVLNNTPFIEGHWTDDMNFNQFSIVFSALDLEDKIGNNIMSFLNCVLLKLIIPTKVYFIPSFNVAENTFQELRYQWQNVVSVVFFTQFKQFFFIPSPSSMANTRH